MTQEIGPGKNYSSEMYVFSLNQYPVMVAVW